MNRTALTVKEFAEALGMHEQTIYEKVRLGEIYSFKIGRSVKIPTSELQRLNPFGSNCKSPREEQLEKENLELKQQLNKYETLFKEMNSIVLKAIS